MTGSYCSSSSSWCSHVTDFSVHFIDMISALPEIPSATALALWGGVIGSLGYLLWLLQPANEVQQFVPRDKPIDLRECRKRLRSSIKSICPATGKPYLVIGYVCICICTCLYSVCFSCFRRHIVDVAFWAPESLKCCYCEEKIMCW